MGATSIESKQFSNISATTPAFPLKGGRYGLAIAGTITSVQLQALALDGSTFVTAGSALTSAGYASFDLPAGQYRLSVNATGLYASLTSIPT